MDNIQKAKDMFSSGYSCAQAVFAICTPDEQFSKDVKIALAAGFGAGIGRNAETCGAVSGAIMAIGAAMIGRDFVSDNELKADAYILADKFVKEFKAAKSAIVCRELLGYDLSKPEEDAILKQQGTYRTKCTEFVALAVEITDRIIKEYRSENT